MVDEFWRHMAALTANVFLFRSKLFVADLCQQNLYIAFAGSIDRALVLLYTLKTVWPCDSYVFFMFSFNIVL